MKKLGVRNYTLIVQGVKTFGTYDPKKILCVFEEQLYVDEAEEVIAFLQWVHDNKMTFGHGNYEEVFAEFKRTELGKSFPNRNSEDDEEEISRMAELGKVVVSALQNDILDAGSDIRITNDPKDAWLVTDSRNPNEFIVYQCKRYARNSKELIRTTDFVAAIQTLLNAR
jgi:hypothetical protein